MSTARDIGRQAVSVLNQHSLTRTPVLDLVEGLTNGHRSFPWGGGGGDATTTASDTFSQWELMCLARRLNGSSLLHRGE